MPKIEGPHPPAIGASSKVFGLYGLLVQGRDNRLLRPAYLPICARYRLWCPA